MPINVDKVMRILKKDPDISNSDLYRKMKPKDENEKKQIRARRGEFLKVREFLKDELKDTTPKEPEKQVIFRLTESQFESLRQYCFDNRVSRNSLLREFVESKIK